VLSTKTKIEEKQGINIMKEMRREEKKRRGEKRREEKREEQWNMINAGS